MPYDDDVRGHRFRPAAMGSTGSLPESVAVPERAVGYLRASPGSDREPNTDTLPRRGTAAGGGYSTVGDLPRFARRWARGGCPRRRRSPRRPAPTSPSTATASTRRPGRLASHGHGGRGGARLNGELRVVPKHGYVVVALSNLDPPAASELVEFCTLPMPDH